MTQDQQYIDPYVTAFRGRLTSLMRWDQLTIFWQTLRNQADDQWYIYAVGEPVPKAASSAQQLKTFIDELDALLRVEHHEDYCGIVYADDHTRPQFIKVFDPNNLGVSCGYSENPPLPGWVLSKMPPINLEDALKPAKNRSRWWQKLFAG